ncbi:hypothetical protein M3Y99_01182900 [Aphelenchoides fujianensis]|nr:hypothetical protein M3Y99_01182900 [Aphelenchoides fujianensis]
MFAPLFLLLLPVAAEFTPHFWQFLVENYGEEVAVRLERRELGAVGSFGGCEDDCAEWPTGRNDSSARLRPVVFVPPASAHVDVFWNHSAFFRSRLSGGELFASAYPDEFEVSCANARHVRQLIVAVHEYTRSPVGLLAASMGTAVARKAVLGGGCAEDGEQLGGPLTPLVHTFVAVDPVGFGLQDCGRVGRLTGDRRMRRFCDLRTGLAPTSAVMKDINGQPTRFEARRSFAVHSTRDEVVGRECGGGRVCSALRHATATFTRPSLAHIWLTRRELHLPLSLLTEDFLEENFRVARSCGFRVQIGEEEGRR